MPRAPLFWSLGILALVFVCGVAIYFAAPPLQPPRVLAIEPPGDARDILPTSPITITFSAPMDRAATESAIRFTPRVNGTFAWLDNRTITFTPRAELPISTTLTVRLDATARSWLQRPLAENVVSRFTTLTRPYIVHSTPALDAQFVYVPDRVTLQFNRAMSADALREHLTITPTLAHQTLTVHEQTVTLGGFFQPRTRYQITLPAELTDAEYGIALGRIYNWTFETADQYPNFSVLNRERVLKLPATEPLRIPTQFTNVSRLDVALYAISPQTFDSNAHAPFETWYAFRPAAAPLQTWSIATHAAPDQYLQQTLELAPFPRGTYYLQITTPEGVSDACLVLLE
ncbi:MAG: Ig-like domain-containing protein [Chloroflexi bacterium]|nr:Ig-like domain-containing protein [Chloroflexota bacterium]